MVWRRLGIASLLLVSLCSASASAQLVLAPGGGSDPVVRILDSSGSALSFFAYPGFRGGVRVALGDVNGDGIVDVITGPGPTGGPHVRVFSGTNLSELASFYAYDPSFGGGIFVAAGDVNGDGRADIITGAGASGGPHVRVFSGADLTELASFFAYDPGFAGGVSVAAGDVNGDGRADIITGAGPGGGPHVRVFSGADLTELASFFAYNPFFPGGVSVASLDFNGDGRADIVTAPGPGGGPHVRVFSGANVAELAGFFAYDPLFTGGVSVAGADFDRDGRPELVTGAGPGGGPHVITFRVPDLVVTGSFFAFDPFFTGGVTIGSLPGRGRSTTFTFTGTQQSFTVPAGVTSVTVEAWGGEGGNASDVTRFVGRGTGGLGGYVKATLAVTPGETLLVFVGGRGTDPALGNAGVGGSNGSGSRGGGDGGGLTGSGGRGGGGGAASVVRQGSSEVIAGGGGGGGSAIVMTTAGGAGGGGGGPLNGANGADGYPQAESGRGGQGGTAAGVGGSGGVVGTGGVAGANGLSDPDGSGGAAAAVPTPNGVGGGGGGGFGGGGAGASASSSFFSAGGGGGGGSSHAPAGATSVAHQQGVRPGNGQIIISW
jgi:FG-GAP-like repeat